MAIEAAEPRMSYDLGEWLVSPFLADLKRDLTLYHWMRDWDPDGRLWCDWEFEGWGGPSPEARAAALRRRPPADRDRLERGLVTDLAYVEALRVAQTKIDQGDTDWYVQTANGFILRGPLSRAGAEAELAQIRLWAYDEAEEENG